MKRLLLIAIAGTLVAGCSTFGGHKEVAVTSAPIASPQQVDLPSKLKEERLVTEFKEQGIRVYYSGEAIEKVEAYGYAEVWQQQYRHVAELDAKEKLVKFLRGESVSSDRKTKVIAKALELAEDNTLAGNTTRTAEGHTVTPDATALEAKADSDAKIEAVKIDDPTQTESKKSDVAKRKANIENLQVATSLVSVTASGSLRGVHVTAEGSQNDGKTFYAIYTWTPRDNAAVQSITAAMDGRAQVK